MPTSDKKIAANRNNGRKSPGPIDTSFTRHNATKHSLLAAGITELDDADGYRTILRDLTQEKNPVGILETELVEAAALDLVRLKRARRLEAEYITEALHPPQHEKDLLGNLLSEFQGPIVDPGIPAVIKAGTVQCLVNFYQRYEAGLANRLFRTLHELERLQRMRQGERLPAPTAVDVSVRAETGRMDSSSAGPEQAKAVPRDTQSLPRPVTVNVIHADLAPVAVEQPKPLSGGVDVDVDADAGIVDAVPAATEQLKPLSGDMDVNVDAGTGILDSVPAALEHSKIIPGEEE